MDRGDEGRGGEEPGEYRVEDPDQIRLLGAPVRQDIVDHLASAGPCTMAEIAAGLGQPVDTLYYHVRRLREAGLVAEREGAVSRGMVVAVPGSGLSMKYRPDDPDNVAAIRDAVGTMLRSVDRRFRDGLEGRAGPVEVEGATRNLWASRVRGRLTRSDLEEVNGLIRRLQGIFERARESSGGAGRVHELSVVLSPLPETAPRRRSAEAL